MAKKGFFKTLKSFSFALALFGAVFASCENFSGDVSSPIYAPSNGGANGGQSAGGQGVADAAGASVDNCLTASVSLPGLPSLAGIAPVPKNVAQNISKSAFPNIAAATDPSYSFSATLAQTGAGGATYSADGTYDTVTGTCSFAFAGAKSAAAASYTLTVNLFHTDGTPAVKSLVASGSQDVSVLAGGTSFDASVSLAPNLESGAPNGSLSLPINFSDTSVTSVQLKLIDKDGTDVTTAYLGGDTVALTGGSGTIESVAGGLPAGTYTLLMSFMKGTAQVGARTESLNVYPAMETSLWWTKDGIGTAATALSVTQFNQKEFYVRGTGGVFYTTVFPTAAEAEDTNNGSFAFPLKTIQEAVNRIKASGDTTSQYTVYIDGKVTVPADADYSTISDDYKKSLAYIDSAQKIAITGWTGSGFDIIDCGKKCRAITAASGAEVAITKLAIKNGDGVNYGGALYVGGGDSTVVLDDGVLVNGNHCETNGGAIYCNGNLYICGSAVVGDYSPSMTAALEDDCGNLCDGSGGGVSCSGNLYLGYSGKNSSGGLIEKALSGGIYRNYSKTYGGGIYSTGTVTMASGSVDFNAATSGGGVYVSGSSTSSGKFYMGGTSRISGNEATGSGGGVYIASSSAKCFISGSATIGQSLASTSSCATSADGSHSNMAAQGGGIYNAGKLYLGYTDDSTPAAWTGSVCYNYASSDGGGIFSYGSSTLVKMNAGSVAYNLCSDGSGTTGGGGGVAVQNSSAFTMSGGTVSYNQTNNKVGGGIYIDGGGTLALSGDAEVSSNKTSADGTGSMGGAGLFAYRASITMEGNAVVKDNLCKACGGGVYLFETESASSYASLAMSGNAKILENTSSDGTGGAVFVTQRCLFSMQGAAAIPAGVGGVTGAGKNDVYLQTDTNIKVAAALTSTTTPVATITPASYTLDKVVLTGTALSATECAKFALTPKSGAGDPWAIKYDSATGKGVLKQPRSVVYVASTTAVPAGSDSGDGSAEHPYATLYKAATAFSDKAPAVGGTTAAPEFENKIYVLSDLTYTTGAGLDGENAYNVEIIGCKDGVVGDKVKLMLNTPTHDNSGFYIPKNHKIKFTGIDVTQIVTSSPNDYAAIIVDADATSPSTIYGECWLEDCTIKGMYAKKCSAIEANGNVYLKNVEISGNKTQPDISGLKAFGPAVNSNKGTVKIIGKVTVQNNTMELSDGAGGKVYKEQNLWIGGEGSFKPIELLGAITGSKIGVTLNDNDNKFTAYYKNYAGTTDPATFFTSDDGLAVVLASDESGNAMLQKPTTIYVAASTAIPAGSDIIGNGSALLPYATVQKAVSRIEELNDSTKAYTIQVGVGSFAASTFIDSSGTLGPKPIASRITIKGNSKTTTTLRKAATGTAAILSLVDVGVPITLQKIGFAGGDATGSGGAINATRTSTGTFDLTITDCNFSLNKASSKGGAIYLSGSVSCTISDTAFGQNYTTSTESLDGNGGAIYVDSGASLYVGSSTSGSTIFTANTANNGGAIYNEGKCFVYGSTVIGNKDAGSYAQEATTMHSNSATTYGGGIYNKGQLYLGYSSWTSPSVNTATTLTGGVYYNYAVAGAGIFNDTSSSVIINSGSVSKNGSSTTGGGGGLFNQGTLDITGGSVDNNFGGTKGGGILISAATTISGTASISENTATDGAGVYIYQNKLTMNGGSVSSNIASQTGGGIYVGPGQTTDKGIFEFNDGTISENLAIQGAGVVDLGVMNMAGGTISQNQADGSASEACGGGVLVYSTLEDPFSMTGGSIEGNSSEGNGGGLYIYHGECSITNGTISGNTAATNGGGVYVSKGALGAANVGTLKLGDDAYIPAGTDGKNDVFLCDAIVLISSLNKAGPVATITPYVYDGTEQFLTQATPGLVGGNYDKFAVTPQTVGAVTKNWVVTSAGYLAQPATGGGSITIHTPEGDLNLAASATTITTSASDTTVTISATDASGSAITGGLTWNGVTVYYGTDEIATGTGNSYKFKKTFPKGTYRLNVSVTYKGTTYSDSFTITKTVDGAVAVAPPAGFVEIPAGSFKRAASSSATAYTVTLTKDFYMCEHEVTQKEWFDLMGKTQADLIGAVSGGVDKGTGDDYPVYYVNWYQAIAYCNKKSAAEGLTPCYTVSGVSDSDWGTLAFTSIPTSRDSAWDAATFNSSADGYRLPTEAEWVYAALGDYKDDPNWNGYGDSSTVKVFAGYNGSNSIGDYAWYSGNAGSQTHETKTTPNANSYGLYDMSGNVFEWCWDWTGNYDSADVTDPIGGSGSYRIKRGGSWASSATGCSVTNRDNSDPSGRNNGIGFRVVRNAP